jgi:hypothetical protein
MPQEMWMSRSSVVSRFDAANACCIATAALTDESGSGKTAKQLSASYLIIIPPNVGHYFTSIDGHVDYLVFRVDANHILPAGYVNDAAKR